MATQDIISLTDFKSDASSWIERVQHQGAVILTQNGRGRAVVQSYESWRQMQDSLAMMQIVASGESDIRSGRVTPHGEVFAELRRELLSQTESAQPAARGRRK